LPYRPRKTLALTILVAGIVYSLPMDRGNDGPVAMRATAAAAVDARFALTERRGTITLAGHTVSVKHEERLRQAVATSFADYEHRFEFLPLGVVPDWWADASLELVDALATTRSVSAQLDESSVMISGLVANQSVAEMRLQPLRDLLPKSTGFEVQLLSADPEVSVRQLCQRQFAAFDAGPVNFEESGTRMRPSAYAVLDRVVALADACRQSAIEIVGHTDSSGSESWNKQLSLARARTIAEYLDERGIAANRIDVIGAGSSLPVADNSTRYGRSLNRRIEVLFRSGSQDD